MAKQVKLQKNGQTVYPQTVGDAVAVAGKTLTAYLQSLAERIEYIEATATPVPGLDNLFGRVMVLESYHTTTTTVEPTEEPTSTTSTSTTTEEAIGARGAVEATEDPTATTTEDPTATTSTTTTTEEVAGAKGAKGASFSDDEEEDTSSLERTVSDYENDNI